MTGDDRAFLAPADRREQAAGMVDAAGGYVSDGLYVASVLDAVSFAVLDLAGLDADQSRAVLGALWRTP